MIVYILLETIKNDTMFQNLSKFYPSSRNIQIQKFYFRTVCIQVQFLNDFQIYYLEMGQLSALFYKNWLLYKRGWIPNIIEFITPIIVVLYIQVVNQINPPMYYPQQSFIANPSYAAQINSGSATSALLKSCSGKMVGLSPASDQMVNRLNTLLTGYGYTTTIFNTQSDFNSYISGGSYATSTQMCFGITVQNSVSNNYIYSLRFNTTDIILTPSDPLTLDLGIKFEIYLKLLSQGVVGANVLATSAILQLQSSNNNNHFQNNLSPMYQESFTVNQLYSVLSGSIGMLTLLPLIIIYLRQTQLMLSEKQTKVRESMYIMGMTGFNYYLSWFVRFFIEYLALHLVCSAVIIFQFPSIPYYIPFVIYVMFDIVLIIQNFFIQVFLSRAKIGVIVSLLFFIVQYIISFIATNSNNPTIGLYSAISIVPHAAFILAFQTILYSYSYQTSISLGGTLNNYVIGYALISFAVNIVVYLILFLYLDQVVPNQWGAKKHPLFCWYKKEQPMSRDQKNDRKKQLLSQLNYHEYNEEVQQGLLAQQQHNQAIQIVGLHKQFQGVDNNTIAAVDDLTVSMYKGQIFALLGHNGAGKTTTISMLTGMTDPSCGYISVLGQTDVQKMRSSLGVCPQHDTLYDNLTVEEHLYLFGAFKGLDGQQLTKQVEKLIADVNLQQKRQEYAKNLSGGQKRRLSVAIAFTGRSKVIVLDQPTSGMDTSSRRYIWQLLKTYKNGRIIILTTHFMDEADYLGDRIGIMHEGKLVCCGSSPFLKNTFGVGYQIIFIKSSPDVKASPIMSVVKKYCPGAKILTDVATDLSIQLPLTDLPKFVLMFAEIDKKKQALKFLEYGISITTLQQVFLNVGYGIVRNTQSNVCIQNIGDVTQNLIKSNKSHKEVGAIQLVLMRNKSKRSIQPAGLMSSQRSLVEIDMLRKTSLNVPQLNMIRQNSIGRQRLALMKTCSIGLAQMDLIRNTSAAFFANNAIDIVNQNQIKIDYDHIPREENLNTRFFIHFKATFLKRLRVILCDSKSFIFQLLLPLVIIVMSLVFLRINSLSNYSSQPLNLSGYLSDQNPVVVPIGADSASTTNAMQTLLTTKYGSLISVKSDTSDTTAATFDQNYLFPIKLSQTTLKGGIFFYTSTSTSGSNTIYQYNSLVQTRSPTSPLFVGTLAAQTILNKLGYPVTIQMNNYPLPLTAAQLASNNTVPGFLMGLILSIAFAFKFASIIAFIVKEREDGSKHQQIVSGMSISAYWTANFVYDYFLFLIVAFISIGVINALNVTALFAGNASTATWLLFVFYGFSYIIWTYIIAFYYKNYGNAEATYFFITILIGGLIPLFTFVLRILGASSNPYGRGFAWVFRLYPAYAFGQAFVNMASVTAYGLKGNDDISLDPLGMQISLAPIIYMAIESLLFVGVLFMIEKLKNTQSFMRCFSYAEAQITDTKPIQQSDVKRQYQTALAADPANYQILTKQLRKVYIIDGPQKHKVAVDNLSFGIKKGEVFGMLGVNGAGKTTIFKMLAGEVTSTNGQSYFGGMKISQNIDKVREGFGYCPQFDAIIDNLTVKQQLELFYDLKSLSEEHKTLSIQRKLQQLDLIDYADRLSGTLSGGNKRKLSVAIAMIGNPPILFLDEPSTGMDPKTRRFMWKVIARVATQKRDATVILTTHSMEEAEALSTRLGIMVRGNFRCIGTPQHIKSKYGDGLEVQIKLKNPNRQELLQNIKKKGIYTEKITESGLIDFFNQYEVDEKDRAQISESGTGNYIYLSLKQRSEVEVLLIAEFVEICRTHRRIAEELKIHAGDVDQVQRLQTLVKLKVKGKPNIGQLFDYLEKHKAELSIQQYTIKETTVQQIFNNFAQADN